VVFFISQAEKLTKDPLRYVNNPHKYAADSHVSDRLALEREKPSHETSDELRRRKVPKTENERSKLSTNPQENPPPRSKYVNGFNMSLLTDRHGKEQSQEEARASASYYTPAQESSNFSLLVRMIEEEAEASMMDESMGDSSAMSLATETFHEVEAFALQGIESSFAHGEERKPISRGAKSEPEPASSRKVAFAIFNENNNQSYASHATNASSTVNEQIATGGVYKTEEETINTKLAMAEMSVMFASPSVGRDEEEDSDEEAKHEENPSAPLPFKILNESVMHDDNQVDNSIYAPSDSPTKSSPVIERAFESRSRRPTATPFSPATCSQEKESGRRLNKSSFFVYKDDTTEMKRPKEAIKPIEEENGDTASFSIFNEPYETALGSANDARDTAHESPVKERDFGSKRRRPLAPAAARAAPFAVYKDDTAELKVPIKPAEVEKGDTATFSLLNDMYATEPAHSPIQGSPFLHKRMNEKFGLSTPLDSYTESKKCNFGDISGIKENEVSFHQTHTPGLNPFTEKKKMREVAKESAPSPFNYEEIISDSINVAMAEVVLGVNVTDCRGKLLPSALDRTNPVVGTELIQDNARFVVKHELGRGAFGIVLLCSREAEGVEDHVALKIQSPTDCLVHEFRMLSILAERVQQDDRHLYPLPLNFFSYGNGGLLSMTSASSSGLNLVDLTNLHQKVEGSPVPELLALYYTSRMLQHMETLHNEGRMMVRNLRNCRILDQNNPYLTHGPLSLLCVSLLLQHCDVKPDNWVLTKSKTENDLTAEASEVLLCDFGKAIDLDGLGVDSTSQCQFVGSPVGKDMQCGSMRDGKPWSFDVDTYGLCASSHVLLFGSHMEVTKVVSTKRWKVSKSIRRYWQKALWQDYFNALLNDCGGGKPSHQVLRTLRAQFEEYLSHPTKQQELRALLRHQEAFLPKKK
jgi:hypothetical protein